MYGGRGVRQVVVGGVGESADVGTNRRNMVGGSTCKGEQTVGEGNRHRTLQRSSRDVQNGRIEIVESGGGQNVDRGRRGKGKHQVVVVALCLYLRPEEIASLVRVLSWNGHRSRGMGKLHGCLHLMGSERVGEQARGLVRWLYDE